MKSITINGNIFDPTSPAVKALCLDAVNAEKSKYILVQTKEGRLQAAQLEDLLAKKVAIHEYVSNDTYLCGYKPSDLDPIRNLSFVGYANVYLPLFVVNDSLKTSSVNLASHALASSTSASRAARVVDVVFHKDVVWDDELKKQIATAAHLEADHLKEQYLQGAAKIDSVRSIHAVYPLCLYNNVARQIINADVLINDTKYKGHGQTVAVADTGFDKAFAEGQIDKVHPAFTGRVKRLYSLGRTESAKANDPDGHGTHVCGSVLGRGTSESMGGEIEAPASLSLLVVQSLLNSSGGLGGIPDDLEELFREPYDADGARIHTNSWGPTWQGFQLPYTEVSGGEVDKFVYEHPDMVICFAAGNDAVDNRPTPDGVVDERRISAYASAKNCITEATTFTYGDYFPADYPVATIASDHMANNPDGIAAFSNRGPTLEARLKPDVVAPGTSILSTCSRDCKSPPTYYGNSSYPLWMYDTGTSMATPIVAGCCAVLRETRVKNGDKNPSAALIKALLINGAVDIKGQYRIDESGISPSHSAGFGRVDLAGSVILPGKHADAGAGDRPALKQGEEWELDVNVPKKEVELLPLHCERLQDDLNLVVESGKVERHGNKGTINSGTGDKALSHFDGNNNVEQIVWVGIFTGQVKIKVKCRAITTGGSQSFAYAWRIY